MTKTFTAVAILMLAEDNILQLDDSVKKYIPEAPDTWNDITIKHLLMHSSGLIEDWELYDWNKSNELFLKTQTNKGFLEVHFNQELTFKPGTNIRYASGHFILGIIIERISGKTFEEFLESQIFSPLSLSNTYVDHPYKIIPNRVSGYFEFDTSIIHSPISGIGNGILLSPIAYGRGDAGILTTAHDLLKFYNALFTDQLLNEQSKKLMFEPGILDNGNYVPYAMGWMNWPLGGVKISEHSGIYRAGFSSQAFLIPKDKFIIIILTNIRSGSSFYLAKKLAALYYPQLNNLSDITPSHDTNLMLTNQHFSFLQNCKNKIHTNEINKAFPFSYYSDSLLRIFSETESILFLGEKKIIDSNLTLFDVPIHTLRYYQLESTDNYYTTMYLDKHGKLVFIDYPELK